LVYDYEEPLPADDPVARELVSYTFKVLDALEIRNAAAHSEVMLTASGPVLVECGARLGGSQSPDIVSRCLGMNQVELTALAMARPAEFTRLAGTPYQLRERVRYVQLITPKDGIAPSDAALAPVRALPSFADAVLVWRGGTFVPRTIDLATSPGYVYLISDDQAQIEADYKELRQLEQTGLYN
jgi:hypothetical protein